MELVLDGNLITNKEELYKTLKEQIKDVEFYGNNLDALWDVLSYGPETLNVIVLNNDDLLYNLGDYANQLMQLFADLSDVDVKVTIEIEE